MQTNTTTAGSNSVKLMIYLAFSFILAFCLQVVVHELGHYFAGLLVGAQGGVVYLHPFLNSRVTFESIPSVNSQVFIGVMGVTFDLVLSIIIALIVWRKRSAFSLPLLMWAAIALIGEGIGMLGNIAALPYSYDDVGQLMLIDISPTPLIPVSILFILLGLVVMILCMPLAGISSQDHFLKKLGAYFCSLPLYFGLSVLFLLIFDPTNVNDLDIRLKQLIIGVVFAVILALVYKPVNKWLGRVIKVKEASQPKWSEVVVVLAAAVIVFVSLIGYSAWVINGMG
jgi:hypothetical protein